MIMGIDGNNLARRMYHVGQNNEEDTRRYYAVFEFYSYLIRLNRDYAPAQVVIAWDDPPYFRNKMYPKYKSNRDEVVEGNWETQLYLMKKVANEAGICNVSARNYEADDVLASIAKRYEDVLIVSSDKDLLSLVNMTTSLELLRWTQKEGTHRERFTSAQDVKEFFGCLPDQIPTFKGLAGDPSDNIPGVKGVGKVNALKLINQYQTAQGIFDHLGDLKTKAGRPTAVAKAIRHGWEDFILYKTLATPVRNVDLLMFDMAPLSPANISKALNGIEEIKSDG